MTLTPTLSRWRGSKNPVPLLLREKGLGDEGLQFNCAYLLTIAPLSDTLDGLQWRKKETIGQTKTVLVRQLTRKIRSIPIDTIDRLNNLPIEQLEFLGEALLDFGALAKPPERNR